MKNNALRESFESLLQFAVRKRNKTTCDTVVRKCNKQHAMTSIPTHATCNDRDVVL